MPFSSNPLMAPVFQSPVGDGRDHRPPVVSIKRAEDSMGSGIRLHHNKAKEGYFLQPEVEGLGVAPVELQTAPLASGGSVARHTRLTEGDVFLPITLVSPVPSALPSMFDALVDIARPGQRDEDGLPYQFEVVVFDPYGQETRSRRLIFESGLGDPVRVNHHVWRTSITGRFVDPYWYGTVRELRRVLGSVDKKFITAHPGAVAGTFEWSGEAHKSVSRQLNSDGEIVARNLAVWGNITVAAAKMTADFVDDENAPVQGQVLRADQEDSGTFTFISLRDVISDDFLVAGQYLSMGLAVQVSQGARVSARFGLRDADGAQTLFWVEPKIQTDGEWSRIVFDPLEIPVGLTSDLYINLYINDGTSDTSRPPEGSWLQIGDMSLAVASSSQESLAQVRTYFDGDTPPVLSGDGAYEFPFFPVRIGGSVVQGEYELQVEGDAPAYWSGVITPPGEDLLIQNAKGERIFVQGRVDEPILIQTRPQEQDITLADGTPIWDRIDPGDDDFFALHPGRNTVHVSMVGATQQSEILIRYREAFFHSLGGGS